MINVKQLASKTRCDDSILLNMSSYQNEAHVKNLEDSLSTAIKSKNEFIYEVEIIRLEFLKYFANYMRFLKLKEKDKKMIDLQHYVSELKHILYEKDDQIKSMEDSFNNKITNLKKVFIFFLI